MFGHCSQRTKILRKAIGTGNDGGRGDNWFQIPYCLTVVTLLKKWAGFPAGGGGYSWGRVAYHDREYI